MATGQPQRRAAGGLPVHPTVGITGAGRGGLTEAGLRLQLLAGAGSQRLGRFSYIIKLEQISRCCFVDVRWVRNIHPRLWQHWLARATLISQSIECFAELRRPPCILGRC